MMFKLTATALLVISCFVDAGAQESPQPAPQAPTAAADTRRFKVEFEYKLLATNRVATMEKEMKEAAREGFQFTEVISGDTFFGGSEALVVMVRPKDGNHEARFDYQLLATSKTSTMQKELQEAGDEGFEHRGQS